jgi:hypothetical protein
MIVLLCMSATAQVNITKGDVSCRNGRDGWVKVNVTNAAMPIKSYVWHDGVNAQIRMNIPGGNYCVTVTDANDCTGQDCITVEQPESTLELSLSVTPDPVGVPCGVPQPVFVSAYATGGDYPYSINGNSGATTSLRVGETSNVRFQVIDANGCKVEKEQRIYVIPRQCSGDPNEILGPIGYDSVKWVSVHDTLDFTIKFENDPDLATAPAQRVVITHQFDQDINPFSFRLGSFGWGDFVFELPQHPAFYQTRLNLIAEIGLYVDVTAGINVNTQSAFWIFESIDPQTGLLPVNPLIGFLPVNDTLTHNGEGFVNFFVKPKLPGNTGDTVLAQASIVFDINEPIITNTWSNHIDAVAPTTNLNALPAAFENNIIPLTWSGADDAGGSGLDIFELYVSKNQSLYQRYDQTFPDSVLSYDFVGEYGADYDFYIIGIDHTGNKEAPELGEASTTILPQKVINLIRPVADEYCILDTLWIEWSLIEVDTVNVLLSVDSGQTFQPLFDLMPSTDTLGYILLVDTLSGHFIQIEIEDVADTTVTRSSILPIKPLPDVNAGPDKSICTGDVTFLIPSGANLYVWSPDSNINNPNLTIPTVSPDTTRKYFVTGTDVFGCSQIDSTVVFVHPHYLDSLTHEMCNEDSVFLEGAYQTEPGFYTDSLSTQYGCDSTVITEVILTGPCPFPADQVYVDKDATGLNNGTSWENAFTDLQDALEAVEYYLDVWEIWIAEGEYRPTSGLDRDSSFVLRDSVVIYGGFLGIEEAREERILDPSLVVLSGDIGVTDDSTDNVYHVMVVDSTCAGCLLNGLTVSFGHADGVPANNTIGAGLIIKGKITLDGLVIERNTTLMDGAAIYNSGMNAILKIKDCLFRLNTSGLERDILNTNGAQISFFGINSIKP